MRFHKHDTVTVTKPYAFFVEREDPDAINVFSAQQRATVRPGMLGKVTEIIEAACPSNRMARVEFYAVEPAEVGVPVYAHVLCDNLSLVCP